MDLAVYLDGDGPEPPTMLSRTDDVALLYPGKIHSAYGEPESGKGWFAHLAAHQLVTAQQHVLYVDFEDDPSTAAERQKALGTSRKGLLTYFHYVQPDEQIANGWDDFGELLKRHRMKLAILDGITEAYGLEGLDTNSNQDAALWLQRLPRKLVRFGAAVLQIDHVTKSREGRGKFAIGAQHKLAGVDAAYSLAVAQPFGRGRQGLVKVDIEKDRAGWLRREAEGRCIAEMHLASTEDGAVAVELQPPDEGTAVFTPTRVMGRVRQALAEQPGLSQRALLSAVGGKRDNGIHALELLINQGHVRVEKVGQAQHHYLVEGEPNA